MPCPLHPLAELPPPFSDIESEPHRQSFNNHEPPSNPSSHNMTILCECNASIHDSLFNQSKDQVSIPRMTNMVSRRNPIYVLDDDKVWCEGCLEEGHFIGDCNQEYQYDGEQYIPIVGEENLIEQHMLLTGTTRTPKTSSKTVVVHRKKLWPPPPQIPFSCHLSSTSASSSNTQ